MGGNLMNFIWDILIRAKECGVDEHTLFFAQGKACSPWYEQSFTCLNETEIMDGIIEINSLYRFADIFQDLIHGIGDSPYGAYLFDVAIHILADRETLTGLSICDFYVQRLIFDLQRGAFGQTTAEAFHSTSIKDKRKFASLVLTQYKVGSSLLLFRQVITIFYPEAILYQVRLQPEILLLYLGSSSAERRQVTILQELFVPIQYQLRTFGTHHFGVLGVDATLFTDTIEIY